MLVSARKAEPLNPRAPSGSDPVEREAPDLERLGDLLGDTYGSLAGEGSAVPSTCAQPGGRGPSLRAGGGLSGAVDEAGEPAPGRLISAVWLGVVGPEVAANARPVQLRRGRLVVSVSSSGWAQSLQFMGPAIATGLNERLGRRVVEQVAFRHAGWEERPPAGTAGGPSPTGDTEGPDEARAALTAEQAAALAEVERLDLSPELRGRIVRAMKAAFVRREQGSVR